MDTENRPFTRQSTTSSHESNPSTPQSRAVFAIQRAKLLFGGYRRGDANDPETYVASIAAVLERYDIEVIREATDPRTGISTTEKFMSFMPNSGELKVYCDGIAFRKAKLNEMAQLPRIADLKRLPAPVAKVPGAWANVLIHPSDARHAKLLARTTAPGTDPRDWKVDERGLHVALNWLEGPGATVKQPFQVLSDDDLRRMYPARTAGDANESQEFFVKQSEAV